MFLMRNNLISLRENTGSRVGQSSSPITPTVDRTYRNPKTKPNTPVEYRRASIQDWGEETTDVTL